MAKTEFKDYICRPFCFFFRPGEKEDLACRGALVVERLVADGRLEPSSLPGGEMRTNGLREADDALLEAVVCGPCPFRDGGCDFRAPVRPADAEPCGGYILLRILRETGALTAEDLAEACDD
jgi:hypothetical protein